MLIDTSVTIAYKCSSCGSYEFIDISYFKLLCKRSFSAVCHCGNSGIYISEDGIKDYKLRIGCIGCGDMHTFLLHRKDIINKGINILSCPVKGMPLCFIGKGDIVRSKIDSLEKEMDELIDMLGFDSYFKNTRVMYDSLNKIHDIAEQGNLVCECGNQDIDLNLLADSIQMTCKNCNSYRIVKAASNEDLKELLLLKQIILVSSNDYKDTNINHFLVKSDGK